MTVFLIVTALVNIGLGYWLAIYFGRARWPWGQVAKASDLSSEWDRQDDVVSGYGEGSAVEPEPIVAAGDPEPSTPTDAATGTAEIEQDMLAGIEEFRNQLAQMKAHPLEAESTTSVRQPTG